MAVRKEREMKCRNLRREQNRLGKSTHASHYVLFPSTSLFTACAPDTETFLETHGKCGATSKRTARHPEVAGQARKTPKSTHALQSTHAKRKREQEVVMRRESLGDQQTSKCAVAA